MLQSVHCRSAVQANFQIARRVCSAVIAVGYMFRYSALAQTAKKILKEHNATPLCVIARYACGYSDIRKKDW